MATRVPAKFAVLGMFLLSLGVAIGEIDLDVDDELQRRGVDTSFESLTARISDQNEDMEIRQMSALAIGLSGDPRATDVLVALLEHSNPLMRAAAVGGLNNTQDPEIVQYLGALLTDDQPRYIKQLAVTGLVRIGSSDARIALDIAARHVNQHPYLKISIVEYFDRTPDEASELLLQSLLSDSDMVVRAVSAISLSRRFEGTYVENLVEAVSDSNLPHHVWADVVARLEEISGRNFDVGRDTEHRRVEDVDRKRRINSEIDGWFRGTGR